jgi:hypothetical protein
MTEQWSTQRRRALVESLNDITDRLSGDAADLTSAAARCIADALEDKGRLVPIPVYEFIEGGKHCFDDRKPGFNAKRVTIECTPGTEVRLTKVHWATTLEKLLIVEVKQNDRFIWPEGVMDAGMFSDMPVDGVVIRDNEPLELYVNTYYKHEGGGEHFSGVFLGYETVVDEARYRESKRAQARRSGFVHINYFQQWLARYGKAMDGTISDRARLIGQVIGAYFADEDPNLEEIPMENVSFKQQAQMAPAQWLKMLQRHLRQANDSFVKQALFATRAEFKRRTGSFGPS